MCLLFPIFSYCDPLERINVKSVSVSALIYLQAPDVSQVLNNSSAKDILGPIEELLIRHSLLFLNQIEIWIHFCVNINYNDIAAVLALQEDMLSTFTVLY